MSALCKYPFIAVDFTIFTMSQNGIELNLETRQGGWNFGESQKVMVKIKGKKKSASQRYIMGCIMKKNSKIYLPKQKAA